MPPKMAKTPSQNGAGLTIDDIKKALKEENDTNIKKLNEIQTSISKLAERITQVEKTQDELKQSVTFNDARIEDIENTTIPAISEKVDSTTEAIALNLLEEKVHKRKWGIIIQGLPGKPKESEVETREKVLQFATDTLKVPAPFTPNFHRLAACHRLNQKDNAAILVLFTDLSEKSAWLDSGRNIPSTAKISVSPDLPPAVRPMKDDILKQRKELRGAGRKATVKYKHEWPFVLLKVEGETSPRTPNLTKNEVITAFLKKYMKK